MIHFLLMPLLKYSQGNQFWQVKPSLYPKYPLNYGTHALQAKNDITTAENPLSLKIYGF